MVSELDKVLKSGYYESPLGFDKVDWLANEVIKIENTIAFCFRNTKKHIIMTEEDEEDFRNNNICRFCEKNTDFDKFRDRCPLTSEYKEPAHNTCNINFTQEQSNFIPFLFPQF